MNTAQARPLTVWLITDAKPGHRNQLAGLAERLHVLADAHCHWIEIGQQRFRWRDLLFKRSPCPALPTPDWVIGAGHGTHRAVLSCRRIFSATTIILMKPSLPAAWFDACIVPRHDHPARAANVLETTGVLNTLCPAQGPRDARRGLILVGGESKHFRWDTAAIIEQVARVCQAQTSLRWTLTNSRRTPEDFVPRLQDRALDNLELIPWQQTADGWVKQQLESAAQVWVSRDSVSMVFESITAAAPTGLLQMDAARASRVAGSMQDVIAQGWAQDYAQWTLQAPLPAPTKILWEADRAARWLLQRCGGGR